jgi:hypothetical protein
MELTDDGISAFALEEWLTRHFAVAQRRVSPYHTEVYRPLPHRRVSPYHTDVYRPYHTDVCRLTTQTCVARPIVGKADTTSSKETRARRSPIRPMLAQPLLPVPASVRFL